MLSASKISPPPGGRPANHPPLLTPRAGLSRKTHTSPLPYKTLVSVSAIDQNLFKTEDAVTCKNYWDKVFFFNDTGEDIHDAIAGKAGALDAKRKWDSVSSVVAI